MVKKTIRRHTISFKHAYEGVVYAFASQPNFRIHFALSFLALFFGTILKISHEEYLIILLLIFLGLAIETINTAIEQATDAISLKKRPDIKLAKDVAAAAMLIFSVGAALIAFMIFVPKVL